MAGREVIRIDLTDGRLQPLTGHVDQDVDPSERIRGGAHRRLDLTGIRDVTAHGQGLAQVAGQLPDALFPARGQDHARAGLRRGLGGGGSDA